MLEVSLMKLMIMWVQEECPVQDLVKMKSTLPYRLPLKYLAVLPALLSSVS